MKFDKTKFDGSFLLQTRTDFDFEIHVKLK